MDTIKIDQVVENTLHAVRLELSKATGGADVYLLKSPMMQGVDDIFRTEIEGVCDNRGGAPATDKAVVLVETNGGSVETVERIVSVLRKHYAIVEFIIPSYAYSAGTILVMSGDEIWMDYYAVLGPIDPQYQSEDGRHVPGMGYLAKFRELTERINTTHDEDGNELPDPRAELAFLTKRFDPARLFAIEQAIEHAQKLLIEWLPKYKFKDWTERETTKVPVTNQDRIDRAKQIAEVLGNTTRWHSHGRGISIRELASEEIKLKIKDFGTEPNLNGHVRHYHGLFVDYAARMGFNAALHSARGTRRIM